MFQNRKNNWNSKHLFKSPNIFLICEQPLITANIFWNSKFVLQIETKLGFQLLFKKGLLFENYEIMIKIKEKEK